jgi:hypothetical protein
MNSGATIHLDFGAGSQRRNTFGATELFSVDLYTPEVTKNAVVIQRLQPLPFPDQKFDSISAYDVLEHLSRDLAGANEFIFYMNELHRVLKKNDYPNNDAFADPTHINYITKTTIEYFLGDNSRGGYAGIETSYELLLNRKLRNWSKWVDNCVEIPVPDGVTLRRQLSLMKRKILRFVKPQHRIWVLRKL